LTDSNLGRLWKNEYLQTIIMIVLIIMLIFAFWFGLRLALNTDYAVLAVASGSMSLAQPDDAWSHPFSPTLHTGDLIIVQGVSTSDIHPGPYPTGDILVFRYQDSLIVHRAISVITENNQTEFVTEGDGNSGPGPGSPTPASSVVGKVVFRIPWLGNFALLVQGGLVRYLIVALIIIIIVAELVLSVFEEKEGKTKKNTTGNITREI
jgi:signal peptidase I